MTLPALLSTHQCKAAEEARRRPNPRLLCAPVVDDTPPPHADHDARPPGALVPYTPTLTHERHPTGAWAWRTAAMKAAPISIFFTVALWADRRTRCTKYNHSITAVTLAAALGLNALPNSWRDTRSTAAGPMWSR